MLGGGFDRPTTTGFLRRNQLIEDEAQPIELGGRLWHNGNEVATNNVQQAPIAAAALQRAADALRAQPEDLLEELNVFEPLYEEEEEEE